jgi:hypothetical protein
MKNLLIVMTVAAFCMGSSCEDDPKECDNSSDCASWQECSAGKCLSKPDAPDPKDPSGTVIIPCTCSSTSFFPGQTTPDSDCASGFNVVQSCGACCAIDVFGNCLGVSWRKVCL